jgi:hypothetical protein
MNSLILIAGGLLAVAAADPPIMLMDNSHPAPWKMIVIEPLEGGSGFGRVYDSEAACKRGLQPWLAEAAHFKSIGRAKDAPIAKCVKNSN